MNKYLTALERLYDVVSKDPRLCEEIITKHPNIKAYHMGRKVRDKNRFYAQSDYYGYSTHRESSKNYLDLNEKNDYYLAPYFHLANRYLLLYIIEKLSQKEMSFNELLNQYCKDQEIPTSDKKSFSPKFYSVFRYFEINCERFFQTKVFLKSKSASVKTTCSCGEHQEVNLIKVYQLKGDIITP